MYDEGQNFAYFPAIASPPEPKLPFQGTKRHSAANITKTITELPVVQLSNRKRLFHNELTGFYECEASQRAVLFWYTEHPTASGAIKVPVQQVMI